MLARAPKPGRDAVDGLGPLDQPLDDGRALRQRLAGVVADAHRRVVAGDGDDVVRGDAPGPEHDGGRAHEWPPRFTPPYFMRVSLIAAGRASSSVMPAATISPTKNVCVP